MRLLTYIVILFVFILSWGIWTTCALEPGPKNNDNNDIAGTLSSEGADTRKYERDEDPNSSDQIVKEEQPMIIWCYIGSRDSPKSLEYVLSSGMVTHVSFGVGNRTTSDTLNSSDTCRAIEMAKKAGVKLILVRYLWPSKEGRYIQSSDLFNEKYYIEQIEMLRAEAKKIGADFVGLDIEPYGRSSIKHFFESKYRLTDNELLELKRTVKRVIETCGKVNFLYPAGSVQRRHPYNILAELAENRISEHTYYNNEKNLRSINYPYEIFGAYVNTVRENTRYPHLPLYLVSEIFENSHRWSGKKGLFLYPKEDNAEAVAKALKSYSESLPVKTKSSK